jgi:hypothetical protein
LACHRNPDEIARSVDRRNMPRMNTRCLPPEHPNMLGSYVFYI